MKSSKPPKPPKPYGFVPIASRVRREKLRKRDSLHKELYHGKWHIRATAVTQLLVAKGDLGVEGNTLYRALMTHDGHPILPGSSVKGMVRSVFEAVTYSCVAAPKVKNKKPDEVEEHLPSQNKAVCNGGGKDEDPHDIELCPACQVFGFISQGNKQRVAKVAKSLVSFSDFKLRDDCKDCVESAQIPNLHQPMRSPTAIEKFYYNDADLFQRKFYKHGNPQTSGKTTYQVVKAGAEFIGELTYENLTSDDIGRLAFSLGIADEPMTLKIGYAKPAYFGSIRFEITKVSPYETINFQAKPLKVEMIKGFAAGFGAEDEQGFIPEQKQKLKELFDYEANEKNEWSIIKGKKGY